jgi:hypothetical protein
MWSKADVVGHTDALEMPSSPPVPLAMPKRNGKRTMSNYAIPSFRSSEQDSDVSRFSDSEEDR